MKTVKIKLLSILVNYEGFSVFIFTRQVLFSARMRLQLFHNIPVYEVKTERNFNKVIFCNFFISLQKLRGWKTALIFVFNLDLQQFAHFLRARVLWKVSSVLQAYRCITSDLSRKSCQSYTKDFIAKCWNLIASAFVHWKLWPKC